ncbi:MAG: hypothetical protein IPI53_13770 [Saprospiraceae bacterium]|nr:hypothetical protein [Saprospiraceae bacterium]
MFTYVPAQTPATTTQTILDNNNVVDWVFVELRTGTSELQRSPPLKQVC